MLCNIAAIFLLGVLTVCKLTQSSTFSETYYKERPCFTTPRNEERISAQILEAFKTSSLRSSVKVSCVVFCLAEKYGIMGRKTREIDGKELKKFVNAIPDPEMTSSLTKRIDDCLPTARSRDVCDKIAQLADCVSRGGLFSAWNGSVSAVLRAMKVISTSTTKDPQSSSKDLSTTQSPTTSKINKATTSSMSTTRTGTSPSPTPHTTPSTPRHTPSSVTTTSIPRTTGKTRTTAGRGEEGEDDDVTGEDKDSVDRGKTQGGREEENEEDYEEDTGRARAGGKGKNGEKKVDGVNEKGKPRNGKRGDRRNENHDKTQPSKTKTGKKEKNGDKKVDVKEKGKTKEGSNGRDDKRGSNNKRQNTTTNKKDEDEEYESEEA